MSEGNGYRDTITRVNGRFSVQIKTDESGQADISLTCASEGSHIETKAKGLSFLEIGELSQRICGFDSISHRLATTMAVEAAFGIEVSEQVTMTRTLLVYASIIADHSLHLLMLTGNDEEEDDDERAHDAAQIVSDASALLVSAREIIEGIAGRAVHPITIVAGGFTETVSRDLLTVYAEKAEDLVATAESLCEKVGRRFDQKFNSECDYLALIAKEGYPVFSDTCATRIIPLKGPSAEVFDQFPGILHPETFDWEASIRAGKRPCHVGPSARINHSWNGLSSTARLSAAKAGLRPLCVNSLRGPLCEAIEIVDIVERSALLASTLAASCHDEHPAEITPRTGTGVGVLESPKGLLAHRLSFDDEGRAIEFEVLDPAMMNQAALTADLKLLATSFEGMGLDELRRRAISLARCYNICAPCLVR